MFHLLFVKKNHCHSLCIAEWQFSIYSFNLTVRCVLFLLWMKSWDEWKTESIIIRVSLTSRWSGATGGSVWIMRWVNTDFVVLLEVSWTSDRRGKSLAHLSTRAHATQVSAQQLTLSLPRLLDYRTVSCSDRQAADTVPRGRHVPRRRRRRKRLFLVCSEAWTNKH